MKLEYENNLLIVDKITYDPALPTQVIVKIEDECYMIHREQTTKPIKAENLHPYKKAIDANWHKARGYEYLMVGMMPRGGFDVEVGRPITAEELKDLCEQYNLTSEDISEEFLTTIGEIYGKKYAKTFSAIQINLPSEKAIDVETKLRESGVEAGSGSPNRVNISTNWGGPRKGSGRPATGRKFTRIYVTEEEDKKLREYLKTLRESK